jgi:hypothetical protein
MVKLIVGVKGTGKTKTLISMVNDALENTKGAVVCIEKGDKLRFDINYQCRLIDTEYYFISDALSLYGFAAGMLASNHDVTEMFIDSALKICKNDLSEFDAFLVKIDNLAERLGFNCIMTVSLPVEEATETMKKFM